jgi:hypothetical protein
MYYPRFFAGLAIVLCSGFAHAVDGVQGTVYRPVQVDAALKGCQIAKPGDHHVCTGDLIELDYSYPIVPAALPTKVSFKQTLGGAIKPSPLGIRLVNSTLIGASTIAFYFEAVKPGKETITILIDDKEYEFRFEVKKCEEK